MIKAIGRIMDAKNQRRNMGIFLKCHIWCIPLISMIFAILMCTGTGACELAQDSEISSEAYYETLKADIIDEDGSRILIRDDEILYLNRDVRVIPAEPDLPENITCKSSMKIESACSQSADFLPLEEKEIALGSAAYNEGEIYKLTILRKYEMAENEDTESGTASESDTAAESDAASESDTASEETEESDKQSEGSDKDTEECEEETAGSWGISVPCAERFTLKFCFDMTPPCLNENSDISWDSWVNYVRGCDFYCADEASFIKRVIVRWGDEVIYEYHGDDTGNGDAAQEADGQVEPYDDKKGHAFSVNLDKEAVDVSGQHIDMEISDAAGNTAQFERNYYYDATKPVLNASGAANGSMNNNNIVLNLLGNDAIPDTTFVQYTVVRSIMGSREMCISRLSGGSSENLNVEEILSLEGDYEISAKAFDLAGNESDNIALAFRIDKSAPKITISGFESGRDYNRLLSAFFDVEENFPQDAVFSYDIVRNYPGGGERFIKGEKVLEDYNVSVSEYLNIDGDYTITCHAEDACGNCTEKEAFVHIDTTAPFVALSGLNNGIVVNKSLPINITASEMFYDTTSVEAALFIKKSDGSYENAGYIKDMMQSENADFTITAQKEGNYLINVKATDGCGNTGSASAEFTIDLTAPKIGWLSSIDRKFFKNLNVPRSLKSIISDLTGVSVSATLNADDINGGENITGEGKYILNVIAIDDAGNETRESAQFIIDATAPRLIVSGLDKNGAAVMGESIHLSLFDEGDWFESIRYDGREMIDKIEGTLAQKDNTEDAAIADYTGERGISEWSIIPADTEEHRIEVTAVDEAGNSTHKEIVIAKASFVNPAIIRGVVNTITDGRASRTDGVNITKNYSEKYLYFLIPAILGVLAAGTMLYRRFGRIDMRK